MGLSIKYEKLLINAFANFQILSSLFGEGAGGDGRGPTQELDNEEIRQFIHSLATYPIPYPQQFQPPTSSAKMEFVRNMLLKLEAASSCFRIKPKENGIDSCSVQDNHDSSVSQKQRFLLAP